MPKDIKDGTVAVCSACEKMCAASVECECVFRIKDPDQKKKFRRSFPRKEYGISELVKRNQDYIKLHAEVESMRAVVEAAREFMVVCEDWVQCGDWESYVALRRALSALDAAKETDNE